MRVFQISIIFKLTFSQNKQVFRDKQHFATDNYFSRDIVTAYAGKYDFDLTIGVRIDLLPRSTPKKHMHHKKVQASARTRAYRFLKSVILEKEVQAKLDKKHKKMHIVMQYASSCNFESVSTLNEVKLLSRKKERKRHRFKQQTLGH